MSTTIAREAVKSSQITGIGYHGPSQTLEIEFKTGVIYRYSNVTQADFLALKNAKSVGSLFCGTIKARPDLYPFVKVEGRKMDAAAK